MRAQLIAHEASCDTVTNENGERVPLVKPDYQQCKMFLMTSYENHDETVKFFVDNNYFGGHEDSFVFFPQMMLPALDT